MTTPFASSDPMALGAEAQLQRLGIAAAEQLRKTVRAALTDLIGHFLRQLPLALAETGRNARGTAEQRACQDLARSIPANGQRWLDTFVAKVDAHMVGDVPAATDDAEASSDTEDVIAIANVELRAEAMYQKQVIELDSRLDRIRQTMYVPVYTKALAPAGLCRALQETSEAMGLSAAQRRIVFDKFDEIVVSGLKHLYNSLLSALAHIGTQAARVAELPAVVELRDRPAAAPQPVPQPARPAATPMPAARPSDPAARPQLVPPRVDSETVTMLETYARGAVPGIYNDGSLAADLLQLHEQQPLADVKNDERWVPLQRITLAGMFLNDAIADPLVTDELRPQHEAVRFPLVKSALTDSTLFTAVTHPLRSLVNELMLKSATSRLTGDSESRRMADLLQQVLVQFDLAPDFVRQAMVTAKPIDEAQIQKFFELQRQQAQERRDAVVNEAKRLIVRQLELCTFGRNVPAPAINFLNSAWGPLLIKRLLSHGADHPQYKAGLAQMEELLDELELRDPTEAPSANWQKLTHAMRDALAAEGLSVERIGTTMASLDTAWQTP